MSEKCLRILVLSPIYPGEGVMKSTTPVVHFFVREWIKHNVDVRVIHYPSNFPFVFRWMAKLFQKQIENRLGSDIRTWQLKEIEYTLDGVKVYRVPLTKLKPHGRFSSMAISNTIKKTIAYCEKEHFTPDVIVSHWANPQLEIMHSLKAYYGVPTCFVSHDNGHDLSGIYSKEKATYLEEMNLLGYRSESIRRHFEKEFDCASKRHFQCYSGIPTKYVEDIKKTIKERNTIIFVGSLIERKYPKELLRAVASVYETDGFHLTYIGTGADEQSLVKEAARLGVSDNVHLLGRIPRDEVVKQMDSHTIFAMISRNEAFGLVYLEAMARGSITIASRDEGFDGIIQDGMNGFLCKAGDTEELKSILDKIKNMPQKDIQQISDNAVKTAHVLTDEKVAMEYLEQLKAISGNA